MFRRPTSTIAAAGHADHVPAALRHPGGTPTCRCATGEPHESPALTFTENGRTKTLTLAAAEVAEVSAALARYQRAKSDLDARADAGLASLRARRAERRSTR